MTVLRCTQALLKEIGQRPADLPAATETTAPYGDWYIHLFHVERRKSIICVNAPTLLSFPMIGVSRAQLRDLPALFIDGLRRTLRYEGWSDEGIDALVREMGELTLGKTANRSVIGSMNELVHCTTWTAKDILQCGGVDRRGRPDGLTPDDLNAIAGRNNRMPQRPAMWTFPIESWHALGQLHCAVPPLDAHRLQAVERISQRLRYNPGTSIEKPYSEFIPSPFESLLQLRAAALLYGLACESPQEQMNIPLEEKTIGFLSVSFPHEGLPGMERWW